MNITKILGVFLIAFGSFAAGWFGREMYSWRDKSHLVVEITPDDEYTEYFCQHGEPYDDYCPACDLDKDTYEQSLPAPPEPEAPQERRA